MRKKIMSQKSFHCYFRVLKCLSPWNNNWITVNNDKFLAGFSESSLASTSNFHGTMSAATLLQEMQTCNTHSMKLLRRLSIVQWPHSLIYLSFNFPILQALFKLLSLWFSWIGRPIIGEPFSLFFNLQKDYGRWPNG